ncbi:MAG: septum formation initiator family protein [Candidatus Pacebacteria bacterium]|nr:septum formation initiator family protein [Candidatus Paceibacterota bacterium]
MRNFQQKRGWKNIIESKPVLVFLCFLLIFFTWGVVGFTNKMSATRENRQIAENKLVELQKQKDELSANIAKLKTDSGVEEGIREKFGLAKEGEGLIIVVEDKNKIETIVPKPGWFSTFWDKLFK